MTSPASPVRQESPHIRVAYPRRHAIRSFESQVEELRRWWPRLEVDAAWRRLKGPFSEAPMPRHAEGLFCFLQPGFFGSRDTGTREVLAALREQRRGRFRSYQDGKIDAAHFRLRTRTERFLMQISIQQRGDIWIGYAQFGKERQGKATVQHPLDDEFNLDVLSVGSMLLTHPRRFVHTTDLHAHCGGERYRPILPLHRNGKRTTSPAEVKSTFSHTPFFEFDRGKLRFNALPKELEFPRDGAVTAFI
jgi:hypothetical protein